jgi:hypothetical protein
MCLHIGMFRVYFYPGQRRVLQLVDKYGPVLRKNIIRD